MANFFNHTDDVNHSVEYYVQKELDELAFYRNGGILCDRQINIYHVIHDQSTLPRISSEERDRQKLLIDEIESEYYNRRPNGRLVRIMNDPGFISASFDARKFPGRYQCSCYRESCSVINIHSSTEFTIESICDRGDGGIPIMKYLNRLGFGLVTN
jgi:hypothetical protein